LQRTVFRQIVDRDGWDIEIHGGCSVRGATKDGLRGRTRYCRAAPIDTINAVLERRAQ